MIPKPPRRRTCANCQHLRKDLHTRDNGRVSYRYVCDRDGSMVAAADDFACGLWEGSE